jgi:precorrin-2 dehydrogenase/sirohydrochlorin ferrochelatase
VPPADAADPTTPAGRPSPGAPLPVLLHLDGRQCLIVGGGPVAARRARTLLAAGARVVVVAPELDGSLEELAGGGPHDDPRPGPHSGPRLEVRRRRVETGDVQGMALVVTATGDPDVDAWVAGQAAAHGALVNRADDGPAGDVSFPAVVRQGPVTIAVGSEGRAPAVSRWLAEQLDGRLDELIGLGPEGYEVLVDLVEEVRSELRSAGSSADGGRGTGVTPAAPNWRAAFDGSILDLIDQGRRAEAKERLLACLSSS